MSDPEEDTDPSANVPLWIERAVLRGLRQLDEVCAAREARMLESEQRIIVALAGLGIEPLKLAQKATEAAHRVLREEVERLRVDVDALIDWRRDTERCPPPSERADAE